LQVIPDLKNGVKIRYADYARWQTCP